MPTTPEQFRRLALALPDTEEREHMAHPDFRSGGRVIASLQNDDHTAMVRVPVDVQQRLVAAHDGAFWPATGAWGRAGCTMLDLRLVDRAVLQHSLHEAWSFAHVSAQKTKAKK